MSQLEWVNDDAITIDGLVKNYGEVAALRGVHLEIRTNEIFGFLGPNGAGKTTLIRCMLDLIRPTAGAIRIFGIDPQTDPVAVRRQVGYLPGELNLDDSLTGEGALRLFDALRGNRTDWNFAKDLAARLNFDMSRKIRNFSKGNKQKVGVIQALMHRPQLLLLDEPTSGLDPLMQKEVLAMVSEARDAGATVFFSSHILSEVQAIADRVAVVRDGEIIEIATTNELIHRSLRNVRITTKQPCPREKLAALPNVTVQPASTSRELALQVEGDLGPLISVLVPLGIQDVESKPASLEEIFLAYYEKA